MINLANNKIAKIGETTFLNLPSLKTLDIRNNNLSTFTFPKSNSLESIHLSFNSLQTLNGLPSSPNLVTLDIKNNQLSTLPPSILSLSSLKILDLSNNNLQSLPNELGLMKNINKLQLEGNPLRTIRSNIRMAGCEAIKKYLVSRIDPNAPQDPSAFADPTDARTNLIKDELLPQSSKLSKITQLVRQLKNTNGDLDLRGQGLSNNDITEDILNADKVKSIDLSDNMLTAFPKYIDKLGGNSLKINKNKIDRIDVADLVKFRGLKELELRSNKLTSFCQDPTSPDTLSLLRKNHTTLLHLDLSQNSLSTIPSLLTLFPSLSTLILSHNSLSTLSSLFPPSPHSPIPPLSTLDISNNNIAMIPTSIIFYQGLRSINMSNNSIKNIGGELCLLPLNSLQIQGNPSLIVKQPAVNKGTAALLAYLRSKMDEGTYEKLQREISEFTKGNMHEIKHKEMEEDEEEMDDGKIAGRDGLSSNTYGRFAKNGEQVIKQPGLTSPQVQHGSYNRLSGQQSPTNAFNQQAGSPTGRYQLSAPYQQDFESLNYSTSQKAPTRTNPYPADPPQPTSAPRSQHPSHPQYSLPEIDAKIRYLQDRIENDYTLSKPMVQNIRQEISEWRIMRNKMIN